MHVDENRVNQITEKIIGAAFAVRKGLGEGFLEKVYENAVAHELKKLGLAVEQQAKVEVWYDGVVVGEYLADLLVEKMVVVELKAGKTLHDAHVAQCLNYLRATRRPVGLLLNFGARVEVKRLRI